jgi:hypothetical protein
MTNTGTSNPSSPRTDLFANDEFPEAAGVGQEYDTVRFNFVPPPPDDMGGGDIPEASSFLIWTLIAAFSAVLARKQLWLTVFRRPFRAAS